MKTVKINSSDRKIGLGEPVYIIAEGGLTNWGNLELAKQQVDIAMAAGTDAIKFQAQTTEELVSRKASEYWYRRLKYKELSHDDLIELSEYCKIRNIDFFVTAHTVNDLDFVDEVLDVPFFKIGSGESLNLAFLENVGSRGKPVLISLGLHINDLEIDKSISILEGAGCREIVILHCNTVYPTPLDTVNLGSIKRLQKKYDYPVGYSDHTMGWHVLLAAVSLGARAVEKHISFDKNDQRSMDCPVSCNPEDLKEMVTQIREIEAAMQCRTSKREQLLLSARAWANQSIVAATDLQAGHVINGSDVKFKRPGSGIAPEHLEKIIGRRLTQNVEQDDLLSPDMFEGE